MANGFRVLASGDHVVCAVSGERILLDELRYWSVAKQEPYASAAIATAAMAPE
jgi:hypothetical protein